MELKRLYLNTTHLGQQKTQFLSEKVIPFQSKGTLGDLTVRKEHSLFFSLS